MEWNVFITHRGAGGDLTKEFVGAYPEQELPAVLEQAFRKAGRARGGVQVSRPIESPPVRARAS